LHKPARYRWGSPSPPLTDASTGQYGFVDAQFPGDPACRLLTLFSRRRRLSFELSGVHSPFFVFLSHLLLLLLISLPYLFLYLLE
jgi:hypothetical protein